MTTTTSTHHPNKNAGELHPAEYLSLKLARAAKSGQRAHGVMHYRILTDHQHKELFLMMVDNEGSGYFSREVVPFGKVEHCLTAAVNPKAMPATAFRAAFIGKSANNPGFLVAILRAEGLLSAVPGKVHLHQISGDWHVWKTELLKRPAEPFLAENPLSTHLEDVYPDTENDPNDPNKPIARLITGKKPRKLPEDKPQHPRDEEGTC